jgi:hypothetical protein
MEEIMAQRRTLSSWRGIFGIVSPTFTAGSLEELIGVLAPRDRRSPSAERLARA